jgi:PAS domain S-box-containing protein
VVLFVILLFGTAGHLISQTYPFRNYTIEEGLSQSVVYDIYEDSNGFLWFSTQDGISHFNGREFVNISMQQGLVDNMARAVREAPDGRVFVLTDFGVACFEDTFSLKPHSYDILPSISFRDMAVSPDGDIWFASSSDGLFRIKGDSLASRFTVENGLISNQVYEVEVIGNTLYAGTNDGLSVINLTNREVFSLTIEHGLTDNRIRAIEKDGEGGVFISGYGGGVAHWDGDHLNWVETEQPLPVVKINDLHLAPSMGGMLFLATDGQGLIGIRKDGSLLLVNEETGLFNNSVQSVTVDSEQNIWFGTWGSGAYFMRYTNILGYDIENGLAENNVTEIAKDHLGTIWVGSNNEGITLLSDDGSFSYLNEQNSALESNRIFNLTSDVDQRMWIGTDRGLFVYENSDLRAVKLEEKGEPLVVRSLMSDNNGDLWVGLFGGGVLKLRDEKVIERFGTDEGLSNDSVFSIIQKKNGEIVLGTDFGVNILKSDGTFDYLTTAYGIVDNRISSLFEDSHERLWIGTYKGGLSVVEGDDITNFTVSDGLLNNLITFVAEDNSGHIWIGTKKGLSRYSEDGTFRHFTTDQGLISNEMNQYSILLEQDMLWIGTVGGMNRIDLNELRFEERPPPIYVTDVRVAQDSLVSAGEELPYWKNNIQFEFIGINYANPENLEYEVRLKGFSDNWQNTSRGQIQFTNLNPGEYTFEVTAVNANGIKSTSPAQFTFTVDEPFWLTLPFIFLSLIVAGLLLYGGFKLKGRRLNQMNKRLEEDVRERTQELHKSEHLFRLISENAGDLIIVTRLSGDSIYVSPSSKALLGYEADELKNKDITKLARPEDKDGIIEIVNKVTKQTDTVQTIELSIKRKNGSRGYFIISLNCVYSDLDDEKQIVVVMHDISERKKSEEELLKSKQAAEAANVAKSRFLASMSHELRTPLNAILGFAQIMQNAPDIPQKYRDYIHTMHNSGEHLLSMINDILDLSKIEAGRMVLSESASSLHDFIHDVTGMLSIQAQKKDLILNVNVAADVPDYIQIDFNKLRQVLINLIGNAIKYTQTGSVTIKVDHVDVDELSFAVIDTGGGIPKDELSQIFDAFHQIQNESYQFTQGTGLGLTISMKLANLMRGNLEVNSQADQGSTFTLKIPYKEAEMPQEKKRKDRLVSLDSDHVPLIYVIDDVDENRDVITEYLKQLGFNCASFASAVSALKVIQEEKPDIVFTDIIMPEMSGKEFLNSFRNLNKKTPVIAVTASIFAESREEMLELGFEELLLKPIVLNDIVSCIHSCLNVQIEREIVPEESSQTTKENLDNLDLQSELKKISHATRIELAEALELMNEPEMVMLTEKLHSAPVLRGYLEKALREKNYRFLLGLNEMLNP